MMNIITKPRKKRSAGLYATLLLVGMASSALVGHELPNHSEKTATTFRRLTQNSRYREKALVQETFYSDRSFDESFGAIFDYSQFISIEGVNFLTNARVPIGRERWEDVMVDEVMVKGRDLVTASTRLSLGWVVHRKEGNFFCLSGEAFLPLKYAQFAAGVRADGAISLCNKHTNSIDLFFSLGVDKPLSRGRQDVFPLNRFTSGLQMDGLVGVGLNVHSILVDLGYRYSGEWNARFAQIAEDLKSASTITRHLASKHDLFLGLGTHILLKDNALFLGLGASSSLKERINFRSADVNFWGKMGFVF